jgi:hypothetical protein
MNYFVFYIPGSMGSLLSVLIHSQIDETFKFMGFDDQTAHNHVKNIFSNTHNYIDYCKFKKSKKNIQQHLEENQKNNAGFQRCDINWCEVFLKYKPKNTRSIICYLSENNLKLNNFYYKLKKITLENANPIEFNFNITIKKNHRKYEEIIFIKAMTWWINQERKYLNSFTSIDMIPIIREKNYAQLEKICKVENQEILNKIIDDYNSKQLDKPDAFPKFSAFIEKYKKKNS